jgi:hypothetical protein
MGQRCLGRKWQRESHQNRKGSLNRDSNDVSAAAHSPNKISGFTRGVTGSLSSASNLRKAGVHLPVT